jgi:predicted NBD/HSP70 family sugar kinase
MPIEHGSRKLRFVVIDSYNIELRDGESFLGDRASKRVFQAMVDEWRGRLRRDGGDPLDHRPTKELYKDKKELERVLVSGDPEAAGVLMGSMEQFAGELAAVVARLLETPEWRDTQCIAIGGGFREGRVGELVIGRASVLLRASGLSISLVPLRHHPEQAGLLGGVYLAPEEVLREYRGILAVDIGGTNVRTGIVEPDINADGNILDARVHSYELWRHADRKPDKQELLDHMLARLRHIAQAATREGFALAPFVAIGCPGLFRPDGTILRGSQNLPGKWDGFNLADYIAKELPRVRDGLTCVVTHNDAVVQGLSEWPLMRRLEHWGVLTIGTGLGNARFTNR